MLSILCRGTEIQIFCTDQLIGAVTVSRNPMHDRHCNLTLKLTRYDPALSGELFMLLRREIGIPLKVMLCPTPELHAFLTAGSFRRKRRCWELVVSARDLTGPLCSEMPLTSARKGSEMYDTCCVLMYDYYRTTHEAISPLTATLEDFCTHLPESVLCAMGNGTLLHCAFLDHEELAYTATSDPATFPDFAQALVRELFRQYERITTECDDCDPCAMTVKSLFQTEDSDSWDTYILE